MTRKAEGAAMYAGGLPLAPRVAEEASRWYVLFMSGAATDEDRRAWRDWCAADPDHERAWDHLARADARMRELAGKPAYEALSRERRQQGRRRALLSAGFLAACIGPAIWAADRNRWLRLSPDFTTAVGERRDVDLPDGTRITLNTDTGIDVRFEGGERLIRLRRGEILVATGHAAQYASMPLRVETEFGRVHALGTRFSVRQGKEATHVALFDGAVEIKPVGRGAAGLVLAKGQTAKVSEGRAQATGPAGEDDMAWLRGELAADNMPLAEFLAELSRYRPGVISCDERAGRLRISGLFPLADTDRVLAAVGRLLDVRIVRRTPYWVVVSAPG